MRLYQVSLLQNSSTNTPLPLDTVRARALPALYYETWPRFNFTWSWQEQVGATAFEMKDVVTVFVTFCGEIGNPENL
jgi:hypothetical protein